MSEQNEDRGTDKRFTLTKDGEPDIHTDDAGKAAALMKSGYAMKQRPRFDPTKSAS